MDNGKRVVSRGLRLTVLFNVWLTKQRRKNLGVAECTPAVNHHSQGCWLQVFLLRGNGGGPWEWSLMELGTGTTIRSPATQ